MKAIVYTKYGAPDVLRIKEVEKPIPKDDEVLIKIHAVEATKADCELRSFNFAVKWFWLPLRVAMGLGKPKKQVLGGYFSGAGGSIGTFGVQIAKVMGAEVIAVDSTIKEEMLHRIGADHFIDYTKEDFTKREQTYDVIFNMVARSSYSKCVNSLNTNGRYLIGNPRLSDMLRSVLTSTFTDKTAIFVFAGEKEKELLALKDMIEAGKIKSIVDKVYSPEQAAEAHCRVETEQRLGIVVISMGKIWDYSDALRKGVIALKTLVKLNKHMQTDLANASPQM